jgi:cytochrome c oxidase subunit II
MRLRSIALSFPLILPSAFGAPQSTLDPAGPAAKFISNLSWIVYLTFCVVGVIMWILLAWAATRRRGSFDHHEPVDVEGGHGWIYIGGLAIPFVILATIFVLGLKTMAAFPVHDGGHVHPEIRVTGRQWWWDVEYVNGPTEEHFRTANEIHIPVGRAVDIELLSADVIHSFWVPRLHGKEDLVPGQPNVIRIEADQPGSYPGQCAEYCGAQHAHMMLSVVAQSPTDYQTWVAGQLNTSAQPVDDQQRRGQRLFGAKPCGLCHTIRGTDSQGTVGPDLTHIGSRQGIAANMLANNQANLAAWVTHAQALKPASQMPNISQFTGDELQALVAYLQSLK